MSMANPIDPTELSILQSSWDGFKELHHDYLSGLPYAQHRSMSTMVEEADKALQRMIDDFCAKYQMSEEHVVCLLTEEK